MIKKIEKIKTFNWNCFFLQKKMRILFCKILPASLIVKIVKIKIYQKVYLAWQPGIEQITDARLDDVRVPQFGR